MSRDPSAVELLGRPLRLPCGAELPNRLAKAAMSEQLADRRHVPSPHLIRLYGTWARSGAGLLITGNVMIDPTALSEPRQVVLDRDADRAAFVRWAAAARAGGSHAWVQLNHAGRQIPRMLSRKPVAPSALGLAGPPGVFATPRELTPAEIEALVGRFAEASERAVDAGFTGVQLHAAHGYLLSQFLSPRANRRTDAYGGCPTRRRRFLEEVVHAVRGRIGPDVPLAVKLNSADGEPGGITAEEALETVRWLDAHGVDLIEISGGTFESAAMLGRPADGTGSAEGAGSADGEAYFRAFAERAREITSVPLMLTGGLRTREAMVAVRAADVADVIGLARPLALRPHVPRALLTGTVTEVEAPSVEVPRAIRGVPVLVGMTELAWYTRQLWRIGSGRVPRRSHTVTASLLRYLLRQVAQLLVRSPRRGRRR